MADRADAPVPAVRAQQTPTAMLVGEGERLIDGMNRASSQLDASLHLAQKADDQLLLTCLSAKHDELDALRGKALSLFRALEAAADVQTARLPHVALTVIAQKANLVMDGASRCVGGEQRDPSFSVSAIAPPTDPDLYAPLDDMNFAQGGEQAGAPIIVPPPLTLGTTESPSTDDDMPIDMPTMPQVASPMR